ncbi:hypothetical protein R6Q59_011708 [Mikania micrantha]
MGQAIVGCSIDDRVKRMEDAVVLDFQWRNSGLSVDEERELMDLSYLIASFKFNTGNERWQWRLGSNGGFTIESVKGALIMKHQKCFQFHVRKDMIMQASFIRAESINTVGIYSWPLCTLH